MLSCRRSLKVLLFFGGFGDVVDADEDVVVVVVVVGGDNCAVAVVVVWTVAFVVTLGIVVDNGVDEDEDDDTEAEVEADVVVLWMAGIERPRGECRVAEDKEA